MAGDKVNGLNDAWLSEGHLPIYIAKASVNPSASGSESARSWAVPTPLRAPTRGCRVYN